MSLLKYMNWKLCMRKLLLFFKEYRKECLLGPFFKLLEAVFELFVPLVMARIIDNGIAFNDKPYIIKMCLVLAALAVIGLICAVSAQFFAAKAAVGFSAKLRHALLDHIQKLSYSELDSIGVSTMITRMTSDVNQVQNGVNMTLRLLLRSPFVVIGAAVMAFVIDWKAAVIFVVAIPILFALILVIMLRTLPRYVDIQKSLDGITSATRENLSGVRVIRAFGKETAQTEAFDRRNEALTDMKKRVGRISSIINPGTFVIINAAIIILIWVGALRVNIGNLTQGQVIALYNYMSQILVELIKFANLIITVTMSLACAERIRNVLEIEPKQKFGSRRPARLGGKVRFENVSLTYHQAGTPALRNISFCAEPGQTIGIIGGTGSGKTTLVNLIPRFYDASEGRIEIDEVDIREYEQDALRERIGIVPQRAALFMGSIRENLLWGNAQASDDEINRAVDLAQASEFVDKKPGGLDFMIEQGGKNLSGGQRQRLTVARALVRRPEILILDDSASALDYETDFKLRKAIESLEPRPTTFIISQRAASVLYADTIIVLDGGAAVGAGTHEELLGSCSVYREIYYSQFEQGEGRQ